ncbi:MAG: glycerate kinase [Actinomycetota bacterium]|nr:glycerate kinase [Actinomycetota bacterium]
MRARVHGVRVLLLPDKFRGTLASREFISAARSALTAVAEVDGRVVSDGGEGLIEALDGRLVEVETVDALMRPITASFSVLPGGDAVVEMSRASGLALLGGPAENDPVAASTYGTGVLIRAAFERGAQHVVVGCGGSATTDGGMGALEALGPRGIPAGSSVSAAVDVRTSYLDAAEEFAPQKGATAVQVAFLKRRLAGSAELLFRRFGRDPRGVTGSGAAGGLSGMLWAAGAEIVEGFSVVSEYLGLDDLVEAADLVITGEGLLDDESFNGKVVGSVVTLAARHGRRCLVVAGTATEEGRRRLSAEGAELLELAAEFGAERSLTQAGECVSQALSVFSRSWGRPS